MKQQQAKIKRNSFTVNFIAGGIAGTAGAFATCPLDVVQTRLQSSIVNLKSTKGVNLTGSHSILNAYLRRSNMAFGGQPLNTSISINSRPFGQQVFSYIQHIIRTEGFLALYKGLLPNLVGIAPSRAIYFTIYSKVKHFLVNTHLSHSSWTHMLSALSASLSVSTITNPIWFLKTRLQLDTTECGKRRSIIEVIKEVFRHDGIGGFYRGLSASYIGSSETVVYFVIYERLKLIMSAHRGEHSLSPADYACGAFVAKSIATVSFYPHEVVRTRLRQESAKANVKKVYSGFMQTLKKVYVEEGWVGLYGGMGAHLMRQVPNTVIMFLTYESIVNFITSE